MTKTDIRRKLLELKHRAKECARGSALTPYISQFTDFGGLRIVVTSITRKDGIRYFAAKFKLKGQVFGINDLVLRLAHESGVSV